MPELNLIHLLILLGMALGFGGYFGFVSHRHHKGRDMMKERDARLFPPEYETLSNEQRKALYKSETWKASLDGLGKGFLAVASLGVLLVVAAIVLGLLTGSL